MNYTASVILLPCHSLEDFPLHETPQVAAGLLANWTALWHPALLASSGKTPAWHRADEPPTELAGRLVVIPSASETLLLAGWADRAAAEGAVVVRGVSDRDEIIRQALAPLGADQPDLEPLLTADFLALGFVYLQVELLTRQMRYMSSIDETHLDNEAVAGAKAAVEGNPEVARKHLQKCFDVLTEARERFYPVEAYLIDLTLVASTTIGPTLQAAAAAELPWNLLVSGAVLDEMASRQPATLAAVREAIGAGRASVVGGERDEDELPLLAPEAVLANLRRGGELYQQHLGKPPRIFGRRRYGLSPVLPQWLARSGYTAALHTALDDGRLPRGDQSRSRWEGVDSSAIESLERVPLDAGHADVFLGLCRTLGDTMDVDHVASVMFAHWPGSACCWYDDLRRASRYAPVLGRFVTLDDFFDTTDGSGRLKRFDVDQYRTPYLRQTAAAEQSDPLSHIARHHQQAGGAAAARALATLTQLLSSTASPTGATAGLSSSADIQEQRAQAAERFAAALPRAGSAARDAVLIANPHSFATRACIELPQLSRAPAVGGAVVASQAADDRRCAVVDVPAMGFAWLTAADEAPAFAKPEPPLAEENVLRNEYMQIVINGDTGAIQSIHDFRSRGNRLSQQLAFRLPQPRPMPGEVWRDPDEDAIYTVMAADSVEITARGPALGEIVSRGRLMHPGGKRLAGYEQTVQVWRGSRVLRLMIELDIDEQPGRDPWLSYYACRFAWGDAAAETLRSVSLGCHSTEASRVEAPHLFEIRGATSRTAILTGGLPYHRRIGMRKLDTLLITRGETARQFSLGIAVDLEHPLPSALELITPVLPVAEHRPPPAGGETGWLFHVSAKNLVATAWEPLLEGGRVTGFRVRLLETEGRGGRSDLRSFRPPQSARQTDFRNQTLSDLTVKDDKISLHFTAHEWVQIEAVWKP